MRAFLVFILTLLLSACAGQVPTETTRDAASSASADENETFYLAYTNHRMGELEPCGCTSFPVGGLQREWSLYKKLSFKGFKATAGVTFLPASVNYNPTLHAHYLQKAAYLIKGLNELGTNLLSPSIEDTLLGVDNLKELAKQAKFPFISANLIDKTTKKRLFEPYLEVKSGKTLVTFVGLSSPAYLSYPASSEAEATDPVKAFSEVVASLPPETLDRRLFILLSSLSQTEQKAIREKVGRVHFYLGGDLVDSDPGFLQDSPTSVRTNPMSRGRAVAILKIVPTLPVVFLRSDTVAESFRILVENQSREAEGLRKKLKSKKLAGAARKSAAAQLEEIENKLPQYEVMSFPAASNSTAYEGKTYVLADSYQPKEDPITPILDGYHESVRKAALNNIETASK